MNLACSVVSHTHTQSHSHTVTHTQSHSHTVTHTHTENSRCSSDIVASSRNPVVTILLLGKYHSCTEGALGFLARHHRAKVWQATRHARAGSFHRTPALCISAFASTPSGRSAPAAYSPAALRGESVSKVGFRPAGRDRGMALESNGMTHSADEPTTSSFVRGIQRAGQQVSKTQLNKLILRSATLWQHYSTSY